MRADSTPGGEIRVWDPFVRVFHWATVALVTAAYVTPDWHRIHEPLGYAVLGLVGLRLVWGVVGTRHARFTDFVRGPRRVMDYLRRLARGEAERHLGHNPAGGAMVVALLALLLATGVTGWMKETDRWFGVPWVDFAHAAAANLLPWLAGAHVLGVVVSSLLHRENLVRAMITGRKPAMLFNRRQPAE